MTVWFERGRGFRFDFWLYNQRHTSPRGFETEREAKDAEAELRRSLRRQRAGLEPTTRVESPTFAELAGSYYEFAKERRLVGDLETLDRMLRTVLQFFGDDKPAPGAPNHNLRLQDPIDNPEWILKFEAWMTRRGIAGATKNRYRSTVSRLYWFAMLPERRALTGITMNPFRGLLRDRERGRTVTLTVPQLRAIMLAAPYHLRLAIAIAALAPKLRMSNILQLKWKTSFDPALTTIRVAHHKTQHHTGRPLTQPISAQLQRILAEAKRRRIAKVPWVIHWRKKPITRVAEAISRACAAAGVAYGRAQDGPTFHTIRHTAATLLAQLGVPEGLRKDVMGHLSIQTTQGYTHLNPMHEAAPLEQLSAAIALEDVVVAPRATSGGSGGVPTPAKRKRTLPKATYRKSTPSQRRKR